jgi:MSHA biogenesis protein MshJ
VNARWQALSTRFTALTQREKIIVAVAVVGGIGLIGFNVGVEPMLLKSRTAANTIARIQTELAPLQAQVAALSGQKFDPDAANKARLAQLQKQMGELSQRLARFEAGMVPPEKMQSFLEGLLTRNRGLELLDLKTLPVTQIGAPAAAKPAAAGAAAATEPALAAAEGIYQHGVEIRLAGSYNDLLNYLTELERMPQRVMWNSVSLTVDKYPRNIMTLRIYTLSLDSKWLTV